MVEVQVDLDDIHVNGHLVPEAVEPSWLHEILGVPDRIVDPAAPAPVGHRNNQIHVYDELGLYFYEHHWTRLAFSIVFLVWREEESYVFTPRQAFAGLLRLQGFLVQAVVSESEFVRECPVPFEEILARSWQGKIGRFSVGMQAKGIKLRSGRRGKKRRVGSVDVSWPHDPWQKG